MNSMFVTGDACLWDEGTFPSTFFLRMVKKA